MMAQDNRPLLTFSNTAECEFFKHAKIEELAAAGDFVFAAEQRDETVAIIECFFIQMLNKAFSASWTVKTEELKKAQSALEELKSAIGKLEPFLHIRSPLDSYAAIERFLSRTQETYESRMKDIKTDSEHSKTKLGRPLLPSARQSAFENSLALYQLLSNKQPGKTKGGKATLFLNKFFLMAQSRLKLYEFTSAPVRQLVMGVFNPPSIEASHSAIEHYRNRGPLLREQSLACRSALFGEPKTWGIRARGNNYSTLPTLSD